MDSTTSVSKGSFVFLPTGFKLSKRERKNKKKLTVLEAVEPWQKCYSNIRDIVDTLVKKKYDDLYRDVLNTLIEHMKGIISHKTEDEEIPVEVLVTGTNISDLKSLLDSFLKKLKDQVTCHVSLLWAKDCFSLKNIIQTVVSQFIIPPDEESSSEEEESDSEEESSPSKSKLQTSRCNLPVLLSWYRSLADEEKTGKPLVIIIPDFEGLHHQNLAEFLHLLSTYQSKLPIIFIFGVATAPAVVYQSLPQSILSRLLIEVFSAESPGSFLNSVLEDVFFTTQVHFRLGKKTMKFFTDQFLFNTLSVYGIVQGIKYCMLEHFYRKNHFSVCCQPEQLAEEIEELNHDDIENLRKLPSFKEYVEQSSKEDRKSLLLDDVHTKEIMLKLLQQVCEATDNYLCFLKCLNVLTCDLPDKPLGKFVREYYVKSVSNHIKDSSQYQLCINLLKLQSRGELLAKIEKLLTIISTKEKLKDHVMKITGFREKLENCGKIPDNVENDVTSAKRVCTGLDAPQDSSTSQNNTIKNEYTQDSELGENSKGEEIKTEDLSYEDIRRSFIDYLDKEILQKYLSPPASLPLSEVYYFDDVVSVRRRIAGAPKGAMQTALIDPHYYLECKCCELPDRSAVLSTLPDLCIAFKIHLEYGKMINLYDWLQAFSSVVKESDSKENNGKVDTEVQARFTKAVSELQFLGFIKPSGSKTDHVLRQDWGTF